MKILGRSITSMLGPSDMWERFWTIQRREIQFGSVLSGICSHLREVQENIKALTTVSSTLSLNSIRTLLNISLVILNAALLSDMEKSLLAEFRLHKLLKTSICLKRVWTRRQKPSSDSKKCKDSLSQPIRKVVLNILKLEVSIKHTLGETIFHRLEILPFNFWKSQI